MRYLPHASADRREMLATVGAASFDDLVSSIPPSLRLAGLLDLPPALSEMELADRMSSLAAQNASGASHRSFLGAGAYDHFVPVAVEHLLSRAEFYSSYTPYQPEISQGTLQTIFEFQSMIAMLTGLPVANASLYEGATALVEGVLMCHRVHRRGRVVVASTVHPHYLATLRTYLGNLGLDLTAVPARPDGRVDETALARAVDDATTAVAVQSPNFVGVIERLDLVAAIAAVRRAPVVAVTAEPFSFGMLRAPGDLGCDVAVGEAQAFGNPVSFGGPYLGFLAAREAYLRQMPGRIVGESTDLEGRRAFVLTLSTREQHIRREKATSNICTNQGLCMTAATIHLALLGKEGLAEAARRSHAAACYALDRLTRLPSVSRTFSGPIFNEFAVTLPRPASEVIERVAERGILAGFDLGRFDPAHDHGLLVACTERTRRADVDELARAVGEALS
jgi:glycine dehydrogenase subunit 1